MSKRTWIRGTLKMQILQLAAGTDVLAVRSAVSHTDPAMHDCWWVMAVGQPFIYHVSEYAYGPKIRQLFSPHYEMPDDKQDKCFDRARKLLANSAHAPKNVKRLTYFFTDRSSIKQRFRYEQPATQD